MKAHGERERESLGGVFGNSGTLKFKKGTFSGITREMSDDTVAIRKLSGTWHLEGTSIIKAAVTRLSSTTMESSMWLG